MRKEGLVILIQSGHIESIPTKHDSTVYNRHLFVSARNNYKGFIKERMRHYIASNKCFFLFSLVNTSSCVMACKISASLLSLLSFYSI